MNWKRAWTLGVFIAVLAAVTLWMLAAAGPRHHEKSARAWLLEFLAKNTARQDKARQAFQAMGEDAFPILRRNLLRRDRALKRGLMTLDWQVSFVDLNWVSDREWRAASLRALVALGPRAMPLVPELMKSFFDRDVFVGSDLFEPAFVALGTEGIPQLAAALAEPLAREYPMRYVVLQAWVNILDQVTLNDELSGMVYVTALQGVREPVNQSEAMAAANLLQRLGPRAREAGPDLLELLGHDNYGVKKAAVEALGRVGYHASEVVPALQTNLSISHPPLQIAVLHVLAGMGQAAVPAVKDMARLLKDPSASVQMQSVKALVTLGPWAVTAIPELESALDHPSNSVRASVARSMTILHPDPKRAVELLTRALRYEDAYVRQTVVISLGKFASAAAPAVPKLIDVLADSREAVQTSVVETLGLIGSEAAPAVPHLMRAWDNNQSALGPYVKVAMERIDGTIVQLP